MKGRQCQGLNSDFPVVSSLGSITSSFIMNSRPLVTLDLQEEKKKKDEVMEKNKKVLLKNQGSAPHIGKPIK